MTACYVEQGYGEEGGFLDGWRGPEVEELAFAEGGADDLDDSLVGGGYVCELVGEDAFRETGAA